MVVDQRRGAERAVERHPEGLIRLRLVHQRRARREHGVVDRRELVDATANHPAQLIGEKDLVLNVSAAFVPIFGLGGNGDVEGVVAEIAAIAQSVARADRRHVSHLDVERLRVEAECDRQPVRPSREEVGGVAVQQVGEERRTSSALRVANRRVAEARRVVHVERTEPGVDDAFGTGHTARHRDASAAGHVVVHATIELRL